MFRKYSPIIVISLLGIGIAALFYRNATSEKLPTSLPDDFVLIAHRGASAYVPEHTLPAFQMAYEMDADYLEIDLQQTKDGELIILHDETLERTTNGTGRVADYTYEELKNLDAGTWFNETYPDKADKQFEGLPIIRLETLFQEYGLNANYYIETKSPEIYSNMEENLLSLLDQYHLLDDAGNAQKLLLQSFSEESLQKIHQLNPEISLIQLYNFKNTSARLTSDQLASVASYATGVGVNYAALNTNFSSSIASKDLLLHVYTVNSFKDGLDTYRMGADGIFTNTLKEFVTTD